MASQTTRDHAAIQDWARNRGATPAIVSRAGGMLRFEFAPISSLELAAVEWNAFFQIFDERGLELIFDDKPGSRFHKFVFPETVAAQNPRPKLAANARRKAPSRVPRAGAKTPVSAKPASQPKAARSGKSRPRKAA
ncbi:MAG TPA: hypothetical protein VN515_02065 [Terriglobales bacterium]|nr:hypothetical protein [Terriglobales bacterium]